MRLGKIEHFLGASSSFLTAPSDFVMRHARFACLLAANNPKPAQSFATYPSIYRRAL